jgi:hypothetical protein
MPSANAIAEPTVVAPESVFEAAVLDAVKTLVARRGCKCLVVPRFGLDLALFLEGDGRTYARFLEAKVYAAGRPGGVGFGSPKGEGPQVELLLCPEPDLGLLDSDIRWILADATRREGSARYAMFDCRRAKAAAMGEVRKGKQNNLRLSALDNCFVTWPHLVEELDAFLFA